MRVSPSTDRWAALTGNSMTSSYKRLVASSSCEHLTFSPQIIGAVIDTKSNKNYNLEGIHNNNNTPEQEINPTETSSREQSSTSTASGLLIRTV